ncbi:protein nullo [Drosophila novamexicana]|uniref:protein nullo n=1 Tax=Drosophila novamexicana TaxID=47314 RepID=UPI0011E5D56D|nr:protein nullo [Drosophila novamexicana]
MGNSHSDAASSGGSNTTPSGCGCCLSPRPQFSQLLAKLRRTLTRHLRPRKRRGGGGGFQRGCGARTALLRPMPRCSSFGSCSTLLMPPKQPQPTQADNNYAQWKCMFEHAGGKRQLPAAPRPHDISEALSGQTTPRGFPSHTDARRCPQHEELVRQQQEPPLYEECVVGDVKVRSRLSFRLPGSSQSSVRRLTARQRAAQAKLEEQLQRELCDLEEYYGGFYYARRNERRI